MTEKSTEDVTGEVSTAGAATEEPDLTLTTSQVARRLVLTLVLLVVLALIAAGALAWMHRGSEQDAKNSRKAAQVAATSLEKLLSFTPTDVLRDADVESKLMTGELQKTYTDQLKTDWGPTAVKNGISTKAEVIRVGQTSVSGDAVKLVVYANLTRSVAGSDQNDIITSTMLITMTKVDGTWRISEYKGI